MTTLNVHSVRGLKPCQTWSLVVYQQAFVSCVIYVCHTRSAMCFLCMCHSSICKCVKCPPATGIDHTLIFRHHVKYIFCTGACSGSVQSCQICQVFNSYIKRVLGGLVKGWSIWRIWLLCNGSHGHPECVVYSPALVYVGLLKRLWWMWYIKLFNEANVN